MNNIYNFNDFILEQYTATPESEVIKTIEDKCKELNYEFKGFVEGKFTTADKTHLNIFCNNHKISWTGTTYKNLKSNGPKCPKCSRENSAKLHYTPESDAINRIKKYVKKNLIFF